MPGVPASAQGSSRTRKIWKAKVLAAAAAVWPKDLPALQTHVLIKVTFFYVDAPLDADNMLKPIQDALIGIVYDDDSQVSDVHGSLRNLNDPFRVRGVRRALADGFMSGEPFVYVRVEEPPDLQELP